MACHTFLKCSYGKVRYISTKHVLNGRLPMLNDEKMILFVVGPAG